MHEYQMTHLAADRRQQLLAEAQQARLARAAGHRPLARKAPGTRGVVRLGLDLLLGRIPAKA